MLWARSKRVGSFALRLAGISLFVLAGVNEVLAQSEPPLDVPKGGPLPAGNAIPFGGWLFSPSISTSSQYADNLFQNPQNKISAWSFAVSPSLTAEWSNGIHTTTLYGSVESRTYPTENELNGTDRNATVTQKYAPLPDLTFTALGAYAHQTISNSLTS